MPVSEVPMDESVKFDGPQCFHFNSGAQVAYQQVVFNQTWIQTALTCTLRRQTKSETWWKTLTPPHSTVHSLHTRHTLLTSAKGTWGVTVVPCGTGFPLDGWRTQHKGWHIQKTSSGQELIHPTSRFTYGFPNFWSLVHGSSSVTW